VSSGYSSARSLHPDQHRCFEGRSIDAKRALYREIVQSLEPLGIPGDHVSIVVRDVPQTNWRIRGGVAACDVDLRFDVGV
jgi:phenylpyruvate tautomerase PptA (4-oxalocrotonate tautomerase family)